MTAAAAKVNELMRIELTILCLQLHSNTSTKITTWNAELPFLASISLEIGLLIAYASYSFPGIQKTWRVWRREGHSSLLWRHNGRGSISNHQPRDCLLNRLFRRTSKKTSKLRVTGLCAGNSPVTGEFPAQLASNAENVSIMFFRRHLKVTHFSADIFEFAKLSDICFESCLYSICVTKAVLWRRLPNINVAGYENDVDDSGMENIP